MRLLVALLYIGVGCWLYAELSAGLPTGRVVLGYVVFFGLIFSAPFLLNKGLGRRLKRQPLPDFLRELESTGRLHRETFDATRAMHFEDLSTGCAAYFIDASEGKTVVFYRQDAFEPIEEWDDEPAEPRTFPSTSFSLLRKAGDPEVLDIEILGEVIEPETIAEPPPDLLRELGIKLVDGHSFKEPSYSMLRDALLAANSSFKPKPLRGSA